MDPRVLQIVFFPILIFASAFNAQFHILERRLGQVRSRERLARGRSAQPYGVCFSRFASNSGGWGGVDSPIHAARKDRVCSGVRGGIICLFAEGRQEEKAEGGVALLGTPLCGGRIRMADGSCGRYSPAELCLQMSLCLFCLSNSLPLSLSRTCPGHISVIFGPGRTETPIARRAPHSAHTQIACTAPINPCRQILFLAVPGVILGAILTAVFVKFILRFDWSWSLAMVFGSMVAATDPVAVVALLEELVRGELLVKPSAARRLISSAWKSAF